MFGLDHQQAKIGNLNFRAEKHGNERVPAIDLSISVDISSDALNNIAPGLRETMFRRPSRGDQLSLVSSNDDAAYTQLRHPDLEPLALKGKFTGYELSIVEQVEDEPKEGEEPQVSWAQREFLTDVTLKAFEIEGREGGTCTVRFKASASHIDYDDLGGLARAVIDETAVLVLTPPSAPQQQLEPDEGDDQKQELGAAA
jgi:hypothetical protein